MCREESLVLDRIYTSSATKMSAPLCHGGRRAGIRRARQTWRMFDALKRLTRLCHNMSHRVLSISDFKLQYNPFEGFQTPKATAIHYFIVLFQYPRHFSSFATLSPHTTTILTSFDGGAPSRQLFVLWSDNITGFVFEKPWGGPS